MSRVPLGIALLAAKWVADPRSAWFATCSIFDESSGAPPASRLLEGSQKPFGMDWAARQPILTGLELLSDKDAGIRSNPAVAVAWRAFDVRNLVVDALASRRTERPAWVGNRALDHAMSLRLTPGRCRSRPPCLPRPRRGAFLGNLRSEGRDVDGKRSGPHAGFDACMAEICAAQRLGAKRAADRAQERRPDSPSQSYAFMNHFYGMLFKANMGYEKAIASWHGPLGGPNARKMVKLEKLRAASL